MKQDNGSEGGIFQSKYIPPLNEGQERFFDMLNNLRSTKVPIRRGCLAAKHGGCMCVGTCQEIIGWRDKVQGEI